jgi:hypothetical protein
MNTTEIVNFTNAKLAGELLTYNQLLVHLDATIDDINGELNSCFPTFSEFEKNQAMYPAYPDYNFFPDKYIRSVVIPGAAYKFYITDEEGAVAAPQYAKDYTTAMFLMVRDYSLSVPEEYQADERGYIVGPGLCNLNPGYEDNVSQWFLR